MSIKQTDFYIIEDVIRELHLGEEKEKMSIAITFIIGEYRRYKNALEPENINLDKLKKREMTP